VRIIRVFPRQTKATPTDALAYVGYPDMFAEADQVHVSVTFTWDIPLAMQLATAWEAVAPVTLGGPGMGQRGEAFEPGMYLRPGYVITSRGCPNRCWFCDVWRREGDVRELPIREGSNILDDNLLACSDMHVLAVFAMLDEQRRLGNRVEFTGGLEAARLADWHIEQLWRLRPKQMFFAYDTPDDLEPLRHAGRRLLEAGWTLASKTLRCYVLCGFPGDRLDAAEKRIGEVITAGFVPMAMLYRDRSHRRDKTQEWQRFVRRWSRPAAIPMDMWNQHKTHGG
jgi:hypothetical protein